MTTGKTSYEIACAGKVHNTVYVKCKIYKKNLRKRHRNRGRNRLRSCEIYCRTVAVIRTKLFKLAV